MAREDLNARLAGLRRAFIEGLPVRERAVAAWLEGERDPVVLQRVAHQLRGVAPSHGLRALGELAARVEEACKSGAPIEELVSLAERLRSDLALAARPDTAPVAGPPTSASVEPSAAAPLRPLVGKRIVAIDDDEMMRRLLALTLVEMGGARAVVVASPTELFEELSREPADVVVADVMMPQETGPALLLRADAAGLLGAAHVVVLSASAQGEVLARSTDRIDPRWVWMAKPFRPPELVRALSSLCSRSA